MLKIIEAGNSVPRSWIVDKSATFQMGTVAQLTVIGNQIQATVSDGTAPLGIIDDVKTGSFSSISWNEEVLEIVPPNCIAMNGQGQLITTIDIKANLKNANIIKGTLVSNINVAVNYVNGVITFPMGTVLNYDTIGIGTPNALRALVSYTYGIPNIMGDDSTAGSGTVTIWFQRMIFQTDQYETNQQYPVNRNLYVSEKGLLTTRRPTKFHPAVGLVLAPPNAVTAFLEVLWL